MLIQQLLQVWEAEVDVAADEDLLSARRGQLQAIAPLVDRADDPALGLMLRLQLKLETMLGVLRLQREQSHCLPGEAASAFAPALTMPMVLH